MSPSRREAVGIAGTAALTLVSGCTAAGGTRSERDGMERSSPDDGEPAFEVRVTGPGTDRTLFDGTGVAAVGEIHDRGRSSRLPLTLTDAATAHVVEVFRAAGVDDAPGEFRVVLLDEGTEAGRFGVGPAFAADVVADGWDGEFVLTFQERDRATAIRETLVTLV
jgi:hypothetical protein